MPLSTIASNLGSFRVKSGEEINIGSVILLQCGTGDLEDSIAR